ISLIDCQGVAFDVGVLASLPKLDRIDLRNTRLRSQGAFLGGHQRVTFLSMSGTGASDALIRSLESSGGIEGLDVSGTAATDAVIDSLSRIKGLKDLDIRDTKISEDGAHRLRTIASKLHLRH